MITFKNFIFFLILVIMVNFLIGCSSLSGPESVAKSFVTSVLDRDLNSVKKVTANLKDYEVQLVAGMVVMAAEKSKDRNFTYTSRNQSGSETTIEVLSGGSHIMNIRLAKVGDAWKVTGVQ
ncbi:hypothetical protein [Sporomusa aerivorans]|uniref:hypothetical protein n=1 Tax=Sporomusa aerivorans TaxID=204936 RepID=UPI00352AC95A